MAGPAPLLLLLPEVAHDVVQVLADQVASSKVFAHQLPTSELPNQLLHIRQPAQSSVRSLGNVKYYFSKLEPGWSWEGLSLLIRGTIGAISGSNSKVEGGQLNPRIMGGSSTGAAPKLFADLAKHSPP